MSRPDALVLEIRLSDDADDGDAALDLLAQILWEHIDRKSGTGAAAEGRRQEQKDKPAAEGVRSATGSK